MIRKKITIISLFWKMLAPLSFILSSIILSCEILPYSTPPTPSNMTATVMSNTSIKIEWTASSPRIASFVIERCLGFTGAFAQITTDPTPLGPNDTSCLDTGVNPATQYSYRMKSIGSLPAAKESAYSNLAQAITWTEIQAELIPHQSSMQILVNPTTEHEYEITATVSSTLDPLYPDFDYPTMWSYDREIESTYQLLNGNLLIQIVDPVSFYYGRNFGQFMLKINGETSWIIFTPNPVQTETHLPIRALNTTAWLGGMADDGDWSNNWGICSIVVRDTTSPY